MSSETENQSLKTGVQISSEILIPGGSNLVKGDFQQAGLHAGLGFIARVLFGLPGAVLVSTNSVTKAITGRHLHEHLTDLLGAQSARETPPRQAAETPPARRPRTKSATKRRKASGSRSTA
jgi:hypothetical protein